MRLRNSGFSVLGIIYGSVWFADKPLLCEAVASICLTSCFCSLLSIGAVAFNRYIHICKNHLYNKIFTLRYKLTGITFNVVYKLILTGNF